MGLWANLPMAIGCAISLTAFTAFSWCWANISVPVAGAVFLMGVLFTIISATGIRSWILRNLPHGVARHRYRYRAVSAADCRQWRGSGH